MAENIEPSDDLRYYESLFDTKDDMLELIESTRDAHNWLVRSTIDAFVQPDPSETRNISKAASEAADKFYTRFEGLATEMCKESPLDVPRPLIEMMMILATNQIIAYTEYLDPAVTLVVDKEEKIISDIQHFKGRYRDKAVPSIAREAMGEMTNTNLRALLEYGSPYGDN